MRTVSIIKSNIKGYHSFKIRPHSAIEMDVVLEEGNSYDPFAMAVKMPMLHDIHPQLHEEVTRAEKGKDKMQCMRDIAEKQVGRVPANLCKLFRNVLSDRDVKRITCCSVDVPHLSEVPPAQQAYRRNMKGKDRRCSYTLHIHVVVLR